MNWDEEEEAKTWVGHLASERGMSTSGPAGDQPARGLESYRKLQLPSVDAYILRRATVTYTKSDCVWLISCTWKTTLSPFISKKSK